MKLCDFVTTSGKAMPCLASIYTLAGLDEPCATCAPHVPKMRETMGWEPFRGRFFMKANLAGFQRDMLMIGFTKREAQEANS